MFIYSAPDMLEFGVHKYMLHDMDYFAWDYNDENEQEKC